MNGWFKGVIAAAVALSLIMGITVCAQYTNKVTLVIDREEINDSAGGGTGYIIVGESHVSKSEQTVWDSDGIQVTDSAGSLTLGRDLFFVHTLYLMPYQSALHRTEQGDDTSPGPENDILFAGACPDWLSTNGCAFPQGSPKAGASAANRIKKIQMANSNIDKWVVVILQGYSVAADTAKYAEYAGKIDAFAQQLTGNTRVYMAGCPETYIHGTDSEIRAYNAYLSSNLRYARFYDWNNEFGPDSYDTSEAVANHLKLEEYYRLWERHLGDELHF